MREFQNRPDSFSLFNKTHATYLNINNLNQLVCRSSDRRKKQHKSLRAACIFKESEKSKRLLNWIKGGII
jgi:hypothetical protein